MRSGSPWMESSMCFMDMDGYNNMRIELGEALQMNEFFLMTIFIITKGYLQVLPLEEDRNMLAWLCSRVYTKQDIQG